MISFIKKFVKENGLKIVLVIAVFLLLYLLFDSDRLKTELRKLESINTALDIKATESKKKKTSTETS